MSPFACVAAIVTGVGIGFGAWHAITAYDNWMQGPECTSPYTMLEVAENFARLALGEKGASARLYRAHCPQPKFD